MVKKSLSLQIKLFLSRATSTRLELLAGSSLILFAFLATLANGLVLYYVP
jgi:uncharacterized membrane protein